VGEPRVTPWHGGTGRLRFGFPDKYRRSALSFFSFEDGTQERIESEGDTRGTAILPGPGFVFVQCASAWQVSTS